MGLDGAEIIMDVEEEFGITVDEAEPTVYGDATVGDLYRCILAKLRAKGEVLEPDVPARCLSSAAFYVFRRGLCEEFGLDKKQVRPSTRMEDIVPRADRRRRWRALGERLALDLPAFERHPAVIGAMRGAAVAVFVAGLALIWLGWVPAMAVWAFTVGSIGSAICTWFLTRPLAVHFPRSTQMVRGVVLRILAMNVKKITGRSAPGTAKRRLHLDEVWEMLRSIVTEELDVEPERVTKDARFVKDLGVG